jgi:hypothetical protein
MKRAAFAMMIAMAASGLHAEPQAQRLSFAIMRNGVQIGQHDMDIGRDAAVTTVDFRTQIAVKVMFINAYSFGYVGREIWNGDAFVSFQSRTNDNGKPHAVTAAASADVTSITADGRTTEAPGNVIPASFWNLAFLTRTAFFHTETGLPLKIEISDLGEQRIATRMGPKLARHFRLTGGLERDLWFDQNGAPLRYQLKGSDNSVITSEALQ